MPAPEATVDLPPAAAPVHAPADLPPGARLVVRALPPSVAASSAELADDLDSGLRSARRKLPAAPVKTGG